MWLSLFEFFTDLWHKNYTRLKEDKLRLSELFLEISNVIKEVHIKLLNDKSPINSCYVLTTITNEVHSILYKYLDKDKSDELLNMLHKCVEIEQLYNERKDAKMLQYLDESSAHFKALNILYKV